MTLKLGISIVLQHTSLFRFSGFQRATGVERKLDLGVALKLNVVVGALKNIVPQDHIAFEWY